MVERMLRMNCGSFSARECMNVWWVSFGGEIARRNGNSFAVWRNYPSWFLTTCSPSLTMWMQRDNYCYTGQCACTLLQLEGEMEFVDILQFHVLFPKSDCYTSEKFRPMWVQDDFSCKLQHSNLNIQNSRYFSSSSSISTKSTVST